jgi:GTPase
MKKLNNKNFISPDSNIPKVAVVGKPNAGKSTLINRICNKSDAIVDKEPMITRDRKYYKTDWNGKTFILSDTGGINLKLKENINIQVFLQTKKAIDESNIIIFIVDLKQPVSPVDEEIADMLRKTNKKIIFAGNKYDDEKEELFIEDYLKFGFGYPFKISALHGKNIGDLLDEVVKDFDENKESSNNYDINDIPAISILGRPNAGKSTLFNVIIKGQRAIVDEVEGTTRDSIDSIVKINGKNYKFIDTAGIRRKKGKLKSLDYYSDIRTRKAIEYSDISLILIDCSREIANQDIKIVDTCIQKGVGICIIFNKIDRVDSDTLNSIIKMFELKLRFASYIPFLKVSALKEKGIKDIIKMVDLLVAERNKIISDNELTNYFKKIEKENEGIYFKGKKFKIKFIKQINTSPPFFLVFSNIDARKRVNLIRYIENSIRREFGFKGTPLYFKFKY